MSSRRDSFVEEHSPVDFRSCLENAGLKTAYGTATGGVLGFLLSARPALRFGLTGFGAGVGLGIAFMQCKSQWDHPLSRPREKVLSKLPSLDDFSLDKMKMELPEVLQRFRRPAKPVREATEEVTELVDPAAAAHQDEE